MTDKGRLLLADDEPTFLASTAELLRREGYEVDMVADGASAIACAGAQSYDLLITDLEMPGNADLGLISAVAERHGGLPVIVLTGFPSTRSAIACIELPVTAYLTKPVEFKDLVAKVDAAVARFRSYQSLRATEERLNSWRGDLEKMALLKKGGPDVPAGQADLFMALTLRNVMGSLTDLDQLGKALAGKTPAEHPCQLMNCPRGGQLLAAVRETVDVLEATKHSFKSKALGDLRHKLELLLDHV